MLLPMNSSAEIQYFQIVNYNRTSSI